MMKQISIYFYKIDKIPHNALIFIHTNQTLWVRSLQDSLLKRYEVSLIYLLLIIDTLKCKIRI